MLEKFGLKVAPERWKEALQSSVRIYLWGVVGWVDTVLIVAKKKSKETLDLGLLSSHPYGFFLMSCPIPNTVLKTMPCDCKKKGGRE